MSTDHQPGTDVATSGDAALPERFENPGLPAHRHRLGDTDPKAARNAERQVALLFVLSMLGTVIFVVSYFAFPIDGTFAGLFRSNLGLGMGMGLALFGIGVGAIHWAKTLMPDAERVDQRHTMRGSDADRAEATDMLAIGSEESGLGRRSLIRNTLIGAAALAPLSGVILLGDLGPLPGNKLTHTIWGRGVRLARDEGGLNVGGAIKASDVTMGSVFHVVPENLDESSHPIEDKAKAAVLLIRLPRDVVAPDPSRDGWDVDGIYAYSKICTHVGCPVALYEQQTHHLLCPCHQSTFDVAQHCKVIFGPAKRPLPQLPITVDDEGYLVAQSDFTEPIGPSFWERG